MQAVRRTPKNMNAISKSQKKHSHSKFGVQVESVAPQVESHSQVESKNSQLDWSLASPATMHDDSGLF